MPAAGVTATPVARSQMALLVSAGAGMATSLVLTMAIGRAAGAAGFALFALVGGFLALARDMLDLGTTAVAVRSALADPEHASRAFSRLLAWRLLVSLPLVLVCLGYAALQPSAPGRVALVLTGLTMIAMHTNGLIAAFQARERLDIPALVNIAAQALTLAAAGILWFALDRPLVAAGLLVARELAIVTLNHAIVLRLLGHIPHVYFRDLRPSLLRSATSQYAVAAFAYHMILHGSLLLLGLLVPAEVLAGYAAAFRPMAPAFSLPWLLTAPMVPGFVRLAADRAAFGETFREHLFPALTLALSLAAAGAVVAPDALAFLYDGRFTGGGVDSVATMRWLMLAFVGVVAAAIRAPALLALGWEGGLLRLAVAAAAATALAVVALAQTFGGTGTAAAVACGALVAGLAPVGPVAARPLPAPRTWIALIAAPAFAASVAAIMPAPAGLGRAAAAGLAALAIGLACARLAKRNGPNDARA